jgi:hypothetical protein
MIRVSLCTERRVPNVDMEYIYIILAPAENKRIRIALLLIYNNPKTDTNPTQSIES